MDGVAGGIAGDMILAAFIDLGVPIAVIQDAIDALDLGRETPRVEVTIGRKEAGATMYKDDRLDELNDLHPHSAMLHFCLPCLGIENKALVFKPM